MCRKERTSTMRFSDIGIKKIASFRQRIQENPSVFIKCNNYEQEYTKMKLHVMSLYQIICSGKQSKWKGYLSEKALLYEFCLMFRWLCGQAVDLLILMLTIVTYIVKITLQKLNISLKDVNFTVMNMVLS